MYRDLQNDLDIIASNQLCTVKRQWKSHQRLTDKALRTLRTLWLNLTKIGINFETLKLSLYGNDITTPQRSEIKTVARSVPMHTELTRACPSRRVCRCWVCWEPWQLQIFHKTDVIHNFSLTAAQTATTHGTTTHRHCQWSTEYSITRYLNLNLKTDTWGLWIGLTL